MQEVNLKVLYFSIYFTYVSDSGPLSAQDYQLQGLWTWALSWWCQKYHLTSHTHYTFLTLY
jgi:hypothetical protein